MSEQPPELPEDSIPEPEREPASYEQALDAAKSLRAAGVIDPYDEENPEAVVVLDVVNEWESACGLPMRGIESTEKALNMVKAATLWIDAGYTEPQFLRAAVERLNDELADALREEGNEEIREILSDAVEAVEQKIAQGKSREKVDARIEAQIEEAKQKVRDGDSIDAIRLLTSVTLDPAYKSYFSKHPEVKEEIKALRETIKRGEGV